MEQSVLRTAWPRAASKPVVPLVCSPLCGIFTEATDSEWQNKNHLPTYTKVNKADPSTGLVWQNFKINKNQKTTQTKKPQKIVALISTSTNFNYWFILKSVTEVQIINVVLLDQI